MFSDVIGDVAASFPNVMFVTIGTCDGVTYITGGTSEVRGGVKNVCRANIARKHTGMRYNDFGCRKKCQDPNCG